MPSTDPNKTMTVYPESATFIYDRAAHAPTVTLRGGGTAGITVPDSITITCRTADVTASDSAWVHSKLITLDAPDTVATGNLLVKKTMTYLQGVMGYGGSSAELLGNLTVRYDSLDLKEGGVKASEDVQAGAISLPSHTRGQVQKGQWPHGPTARMFRITCRVISLTEHISQSIADLLTALTERPRPALRWLQWGLTAAKKAIPTPSTLKPSGRTPARSRKRGVAKRGRPFQRLVRPAA